MLLLEVNDLIVKRMHELGWRKADLAERMGVSRPFVTKLLDGNANLTLRTLVKITNVLGIKLRVAALPQHVADFLASREEFLPVDRTAVTSQEEIGDAGPFAIAA
jgi:transcriptional regulator with XRE-family HTH domain